MNVKRIMEERGKGLEKTVDIMVRMAAADTWERS
jgi:hypothetical protein